MAGQSSTDADIAKTKSPKSPSTFDVSADMQTLETWKEQSLHPETRTDRMFGDIGDVISNNPENFVFDEPGIEIPDGAVCLKPRYMLGSTWSVKTGRTTKESDTEPLSGPERRSTDHHSYQGYDILTR